MHAGDVPPAPTIQSAERRRWTPIRQECTMRKRKAHGAPPPEPVAANGLLHRRALLTGGVVFAGAMSTGAAVNRAAAEPLKDPEWSLMPGEVTPVLQKPSRFEAGVVRILSNPKGEPRTQHARAPLQMLDGTITPNPLHFTIPP